MTALLVRIARVAAGGPAMQGAAWLLAVLMAAPAAAADEVGGAEPPAPLVLGVVHDSEGAPVAGARLWLVGGNYGAPELLGETTSDAEGGFAFTSLPAEDAVFANPGQLTVWARHDGAGLGWFNGLYNHRRTPLSVELAPSAECRGRLSDPEGGPIAGAQVTPRILLRTELGVGGGDYGQLPPEWSREKTVTTGPDGSFAIPGLPTTGALSAGVSKPGYGRPTVMWNLGAPASLSLAPAGSLAGSIAWHGGEPPAGLDPDKPVGTLNVYGYVRREGSNVSVNEEASIQADGTFRVDGLPPGQYRLSAAFAAGVAARPGAVVEVNVEPGQATRGVSLTTEPGVWLRGRVLAFADKRPVGGATVTYNRIEEGRSTHEGQCVTDQDGAHAAFVREGTYQIQVLLTPDRYVPLNSSFHSGGDAKSRMPRLAVAADTQWPDLLLDPAGDLAIEVVDEAGRPAAGAVVHVVCSVGVQAELRRSIQKADASGRFTIRGVALNDTLPIRVRTPDAISKPSLVVTPEKVAQPLRVELSTAHGFRFRCKVVDPEGEPIAGATIHFGTSYPYATKWQGPGGGVSVSGTAGTATTDASGEAQSDLLWNDLNYWVSASAEGYSSAEAPQVHGISEEVLTLNPLVLAKAAPPTTGTVVGADGAPLGGVRVFAAGSEWGPAVQLTGRSGAFRLEKTAPDVRWVFADKEGYRLGGARLPDDGSAVRIELRADDATPVGLPAVPSPDLQQRRAAARELIELAWKLPTDPRSTARMSLLEGMTRIDIERADAMSGEVDGAFGYVVRSQEARDVIREDPQRGLTLLIEAKAGGQPTVIELAKRFARSPQVEERGLALPLANIAAQRAEATGASYDFARAAMLQSQLGFHDAAELMAAKAFAAVDKEPNPSRQEAATQSAAAALAPYELAGALEMANIGDSDFSRIRALARVAVAAAVTDPDAAIAALESLKGDANAVTSRDRGRLKIAMQIVATDTAGAAALVRRCEDAGNRAQALGYLAVEVAPVDQQLAWTLIDEALAIHRGSPDAYQGYINYGQAGPFAGLLAYQASLVGYPDMESVVWHVMAAARAQGRSVRGQARLQVTIGTARFLALVDPAAARELLLTVGEQEDQLPRGDGGVSLYDQWLQAWLLVDFAHGAELLKQDLRRLADGGKQDPLRHGHGGVFRLLTAHPEERVEIVNDSETGLWKLDEE
ncbi:Cna protein B-type domain protein [Pirellulimonas nuda]|uniref:Cna protein B-type domain protein n=1 Tax=Pirellulimonas nuda TaxID=2528009 RepID=A0A518DEG0_9BACT|nr:carboxypeptidase-like regulatory domain-containing protein [Pirellulimonas nuda]QDU89822.1 Cna protein B-type domain protein [Pirellulimonas nuda]